MSQAPQLERGEMSAAEHANQKLAEQIMVLMAKALREGAKRYPPKLRLSEHTADTRLEISFGGEKVYSAALGADSKVKSTYINSISDSQAQFLQEALSKSKGESLNNPMVRDMRVLVNGTSLFQVKNGKITQNDLPNEFKQAITTMVQPKPLEVALQTHPSELKAAQLQQDASVKRHTSGVSSIPLHETSSTNGIHRSSLNQTWQNSSGAATMDKPLNQQLMAEAKKCLDRLLPNQPKGNRQWKHDKYTLTEKNGVTSVFIAETKQTVTQQGRHVVGHARPKDVNALKQVNAAIAQQRHQSQTRGVEAEL